jgi:hypothetical protein
MKLSEVIDRLESLKKAYGDIRVFLPSDCGTYLVSNVGLGDRNEDALFFEVEENEKYVVIW